MCVARIFTNTRSVCSCRVQHAHGGATVSASEPTQTRSQLLCMWQSFIDSDTAIEHGKCAWGMKCEWRPPGAAIAANKMIFIRTLFNLELSLSSAQRAQTLTTAGTPYTNTHATSAMRSMLDEWIGSTHWRFVVCQHNQHRLVNCLVSTAACYGLTKLTI